MCGIAGIYSFNNTKYPNLLRNLKVMNKLLEHRGPDDEGHWVHKKECLGFGHKRLSIIDLVSGKQPMTDNQGNWITFNGEIYNYIELRKEIGIENFKTNSDTEVILKAYRKWGEDCLNHLRGMFAFSIWDERENKLFCARDRFGIKPFYYSKVDNTFYFASEVKALLPFQKEIKENGEALKDYLIFQIYLQGKTLFKNIEELLPGHKLIIKNNNIKIKRYWEVYYNIDWEHTDPFFQKTLKKLLYDSVNFNIRSDVEVGSYLSGGVDSGIISTIASKFLSKLKVFNGKFSEDENFDESKYAKIIASQNNMDMDEINITSTDFIENIRKIIYYLDYPIAGPGSFPQFIVSKKASEKVKVILGGQGGDEIFGGYVRYLIAYFEQCIKGAIDNTLNNGNFVVTYESIIPNLTALQGYKGLLKEFFKNGLFEDLDKRYYRLINRSNYLKDEIKWDEFTSYDPFDSFRKIFNGDNVGKQSYFDKMTHYDFKTLLPSLLHVEDRVSMAFGLESRVPFLDSKLVEFSATMPADIKFKNGTLKKVLINSMKDSLPSEIINRKDKMGFPVPLNKWINNELKDFIFDIFNQEKSKNRQFFNNKEIKRNLRAKTKFSRKIWGLLSLELWYQEFIDKENYFFSLKR